MSDDSQETSEVYNYYLELSKPTEEDLKRVFSQDELIELCLKTKCKVDIWRWNVVYDYRVLFTKSGRYQRWSEKDRLRMLAKAVNKMKPTVLYDEEEIKKKREEEWKFQLKDNILSLDYWKRVRKDGEQKVLTESDDIDPELQLQFEINTESANPSQRLDLEKETAVSEELSNRDKHAPAIDENIDDDIDEDFLNDMTYSEDSLDTVMSLDHQKPCQEILHSEEVAPEIANIYGINTLSMTIDSEASQKATQELAVQHSEEVIPANYDNFKNIIPLTSTQSQSQGTEEVIVS